jgi:predicted secreted hydrolase
MLKRILTRLLMISLVIAGWLYPFLSAQAAVQATTPGTKATVEWRSSPTDSLAFKKVFSPTSLQFPQDLGPHEDYQTEWWYYTGNLTTDTGRPFGYELTIFRRGLTPGLIQPTGTDPSAWHTNQVYFAHFTLSDIQQQTFYPAERFSRGAANLAGAQSQPYQVWIEDWRIQAVEPNVVQLSAKTDEVTLKLRLQQTLAPILQGDHGYSQKGPELGNASYYYSIVQQPTQGTISIQGETFAVNGVSWKDHEYSTSALSPGTEGWDWFSLQFDDGSALMLYGLRQADGTMMPQSSGTFIAADGKTQHLGPTDWTTEVLATWKSPKSGAQYPARWRFTLPTLATTLTVQPLMADQELRLSTTYWEGAVQVAGERADHPIHGFGYTELTGYARKLSF